MKKLVDPLKDPNSYRFARIPYPILATKALDRTEKLLWALVYSFETSDGVEVCHLGVRQCAEILGTSPGAVRRVRDSLVEKGFLRTPRPGAVASGLQRGRMILETLWPDELIDERFVRRKRAIEMLDEGGDELIDGEQGGITMIPGGDHDDPPGGITMIPLGGSRRSPINTSNTEVNPPSTLGGSKRDLLPPSKGDDSDEVEDPENDRVARRRGEEKRSRKPTTPRKRRPSGEKFEKYPSRRWEFHRWRAVPEDPESDSKATGLWKPIDVLGYWACRFRERRGEEDRGMYFGTLKRGPALVLIRNVGRFVETYFDGKYAFARKAVDEILELAEAAGRPVSLRYFFTPRSDEALRSLTSGVRRRRESNIEVDDRQGSDVEMWDRLAGAGPEELAKAIRSGGRGYVRGR